MTFRSLGYRGYRLFFSGQIVSTVGTWAQKVAQAWLVLELTGSGTMLGLTAGLQQAPTLLLTPWAGLLADRVDRRVILIRTQWAAAVPALALVVVTATDRVTVPIVMVLAVVLGVVEAFDKPVRHTFAADVVPPADVPNAVALNSTMFNAGKVLGPAAAGIAISVAGVAAAFAFNALSYLVMVVALLRIRPSEVHPQAVVPKGPGALRAGFRYARGTPTVFSVLALTAVTGLVAYEWNTLVPLLARAFSPDAATIGYFFAAMGAGAIVGSLALAGILVAAPRTVFIGAITLAVMLGLVAVAPSYALVLLALFLLGAAATIFRAMATAVVQLESEPMMRGRVVSLMIIGLSGTSPLSGPLIGAVAEYAGPRVAASMGAAVTAVAAALSWHYLRRSRSVVERSAPPRAPS